MICNIALLFTSACYFYAWAIFGFALLTNSNEPVLGGVYTALSLLFPSFFGSLFFVALNQKKSDKWFLGLPLLIIFLILILNLYVSGMLTVTTKMGGLTNLTPIISLHVPVEVFVILLALVAPASLLFIQSVPEELRKSTKKYVKVAKVVSIYAAIIGFMYFINNSLAYGMLFIYVAFGLPLIGICLVLMARKFPSDF